MSKSFHTFTRLISVVFGVSWDFLRPLVRHEGKTPRWPTLGHCAWSALYFIAIASHCISLSFTAFIEFHCISWHFMAFHCISLDFIAFHWVSLHLMAFHGISLHLVAFHCISLHISAFMASHCTSLHLIAFHCVSLRFMCVSMCFGRQC